MKFGFVLPNFGNIQSISVDLYLYPYFEWDGTITGRERAFISAGPQNAKPLTFPRVLTEYVAAAKKRLEARGSCRP
jgi:hypothetical protein